MRARHSCFGLPALALGLAACGDEALKAECSLVVVNQTSCSLSIYVDGQLALAVCAGTDRTLDDIGPGDTCSRPWTRREL